VALRFIPQNNINQSRQLSRDYWNAPNSGGKFSGLEYVLSGLGYGLLAGDANSAENRNRDYRSTTMAQALEAPDTPSMARILMGSGVPGMDEQGMGLVVQDRQTQGNRKWQTSRDEAAFARQKKLAEFNNAAALQRQKELAEFNNAAALQRQRDLVPVEVDKAQQVAELKSVLSQKQRVAMLRERAQFAEQIGLDPNGLEYRHYVLTGNMPAPRKPRSFSVTDVTKLSEEGGRLETVDGQARTFKDEYAGYTVGGDLAMNARRRGLWSPASSEAAGWWQGYDRYKNLVRNDLFGAALTAQEAEQFEKADIQPNMDPVMVRQNLAKQRAAIESAMKKKAAALIASGYDPEAVYQAYGITGAPAAQPPPAEATASGASPETAVPVTSPDEAKRLPPGTFIRLPDGSTGRVPNG